MVLLLVSGVLAGCSAVRFGYNQGPELVFWWLETTRSQVWSFGPSWMHTWHTPFMFALTTAALGMKFALKIH